MTLTPAGPPDEQGRQVFKPVVATVTGFSKYNPNQFGLSDIDGFWALAPKLQEAMGTPKLNTKALWTLSHKPKPMTDPRTKPGSMYCDVIAVGKVPQDYQPDADEVERVETGIRTEQAQTAPATGQDMSGAQAAIWLRLHKAYATYLASPEPRKPWELPMQAQIEAKAIERESIEKQVAFKACAEIIVAHIAKGTDIDPDVATTFVRLLPLLAHLPAAEPLAPEATTPPTTAEPLPWGDEEKKP